MIEYYHTKYPRTLAIRVKLYDNGSVRSVEHFKGYQQYHRDMEPAFMVLHQGPDATPRNPRPEGPVWIAKWYQNGRLERPGGGPVWEEYSKTGRLIYSSDR